MVGIVTNRDLRFENNLDQPVKNIMTPREQARDGEGGRQPRGSQGAHAPHRLERVLVINGDWELRGLMTVKDILKSSEHPERLQGPARAPARRRRGRRGRRHRGARRAAGRGGRRRDRRRYRARTRPGRARPREVGQEEIPPDAGGRRQHRHARRPPRPWSTTAPTASRSASAPAPSAPRASSRRRRAADHRDPERRRGAAGHSACRASPTAASATRATSPRRSPRAPIQRHARQPLRRHRGGARGDRALPGPLVQVLSRHGLARRDAEGLERPLLPGRRDERRQARARGRRRPRALQGPRGRRSSTS